jgi:hypothetical protein
VNSTAALSSTPVLPASLYHTPVKIDRSIQRKMGRQGLLWLQ